MSQPLLKDPVIVSGPTRTGVGTGSLSIDRLTHFTTPQTYTLTCIAKSPDTIFSVVGSVDGPVGIAAAGIQFRDDGSKIFLTIQQGAIAFEVGDKFVVQIANGTDLHQDNIDLYDELPQKNFGPGVKGQLNGDHNIRFSDALVRARLALQDLLFEAVTAGPNGNNVQIEYPNPIPSVAASRIEQDLTFTAKVAGVAGNALNVQYQDWVPGTRAQLTVQQILFRSIFDDTSGNSVSIAYVADVSAGSEYVSVAGNAVTIHFQSGVTLAQTIIDLVNADPAAQLLIEASLAGGNIAQSGPFGPALLIGGVDPVAPAGSEIVTVSGSTVTVQFQSNLSTASQIASAIAAHVDASALISVMISGTGLNAQVVMTDPLALSDGSNGMGDAGVDVAVSSNTLQVYFRSGIDKASAIASAVAANPDAVTLVSVTQIGGDNPQFSPVSPMSLSGGLARYFSLNQHELTDVPNFHEGNASVQMKDLRVQGTVEASGHALFKNVLSLNDTASGPAVGNVQEMLGEMVSQGKALLKVDNDSRVLWANESLTLLDPLRIILPDLDITNTIAAGVYAISEGQHLYVEVSPKTTGTLVPYIGVIPRTQRSLRIVSVVDGKLVWFNNAVQKPFDIVRIGGQNDLRAQVMALVTGGGTVSHSGTTLGEITWSSPIQVRQVGRIEFITVPAGTTQLADGEVAYIAIPDPWVTATTSIQVAALSTSELQRTDRFWLFYRQGSTIHVRSGGAIATGEESTIGNEISADLFAYIGSAGETDNDPDYSSASSGTNRYLTDGDSLTKSIKKLDQRLATVSDAEAQDRNAHLVGGGVYTFDGSNLSWSTTAYVRIPGLADSANILAALSLGIGDGQIAYVDLNRSGTGGALTITIVDVSSYVPADGRFVIASRLGSEVFVGGMRLTSGESKPLGAGASNQTLAFIGASGANDASPDYSGASGSAVPNRYVVDAEKLTRAIKRLDARLGEVADMEIQDRNAKLVRGGLVTWNLTTTTLNLGDDAFVQIPGLPEIRNQIAQGNYILANDGDVAYCYINRTGLTPATLAISILPHEELPLGDAIFVIARRLGDNVLVGNTLLKDGQGFLLDEVGSGGSGSMGITVVKMLNAVDPTFPTSSSALIDGQAISDNDLVLFTGLSDPASNNRVYVASVTGATVSWNLQRFGQSTSGAPLGGDVVYIKSGTNFADTIFAYSATTDSWIDYSATKSADRKLSNLTSPTAVNQDLIPGAHNAKDLGAAGTRWRTTFVETAHATAIRKGTSTRFVEETYIDGQTITGGSTAVFAPFTFDTTIHKALRAEYVIYDPTSGARKFGTLDVVVDGAPGVAASTASITDRSTETADPGVTWTAAVNGNNVELTATTTAGNKTLHAELKKFLS